MLFGGTFEIHAGVAVAVKPALRSGPVASCPSVVMNLLSYSGDYDIVLRDFGLMLAGYVTHDDLRLAVQPSLT
jgi:hypothetical protein